MTDGSGADAVASAERAAPVSISASADALWVALRHGRDVALLEKGAVPPVGRLALENDEVDLALIGPPTVLATVTRDAAPRVVLHHPPALEPVARHDLAWPARLAAQTGPRLVVVSLDGKHVTIVRAAGRALAVQAVDPGSPVEFAVGLERNQVLFGLHRKLEVWDAASARPLLRLQLQLPPPPRTVGAAQGHLWVTRPGSEELFVYRLSDGRPFRHYAGSPIQEVIHHPASPVVVVVTSRGLVRLHCFAHSLSVVHSPWTPGTPLALLGTGEDVSLIGLGAGADEPWRVPIPGGGAPAEPSEPDSAMTTDKAREIRQRLQPEPPAERDTPLVIAPPPRSSKWREPLVTIGTELARGAEIEIPVAAAEHELGELAQRLGLGTDARRALTAIYALYLVGETLPIAKLAHALGDWTEALGQGELGALAMLRRRDGQVALRGAVTAVLDGAPPRAIRLVGVLPGKPCSGAFRISRDGKSNALLEADLAAKLGRIAIIEGAADRALLEARLHGATAVSFHAPDQPPRPWPRDAGLVLVLPGTPSSWHADLPALT